MLNYEVQAYPSATSLVVSGQKTMLCACLHGHPPDMKALDASRPAAPW